MCSENFFKKSENFGPQKMNKFIGGSEMILQSYWGRLLSFAFRNEDNSKDSRVYYNHYFGVINAGVSP